MSHLLSRIAAILLVGTFCSSTVASGSLNIRIIDGATGQLLPVRVYVTGSNGKPYWPRQRGDHSIVHYDIQRGSSETYATVGAHPFDVEVPAGETTVTIERGKEYVPVTQTITVPEGETVSAVIRLQRAFDMAAMGWYSGDLHVHTPPNDLPSVQLAEDLNVAFPITAWATNDKQIPGTKDPAGVPESGQVVSIDQTHVYWSLNSEYEIFSAEGLEGELGAILILGHKKPFTLTAPPIGPVIAEARQQGCILDWDKHCWPWSTMLVPVAGIDTMELSNNHMWRLKPHWGLWGEKPPAWMNCSNDAAGWASYGFQAYYALLNSGFRLRPSAGTANGVHPVPLGHSRVYVRLPNGFTYDKWVKGLQAGRSFVTNGPMLFFSIEDLQPGQRRRLGDGRTARLNVSIEARSIRGIDRVEIVRNGKVIRTWKPADQADRHRCRFSLPVEVAGSCWVAARCFEIPMPDNVRFAHSSPIFFNDPDEPLLPAPHETKWLTDTVEKQIERLEGRLPKPAVDEFRQARDVYRKTAHP